jgi:hypothetical protein
MHLLKNHAMQTTKGKALGKKMGIPPWDLKSMRTKVLDMAAKKRANAVKPPSKFPSSPTMVPTGKSGHTNPQVEAQRKALQGVNKSQKVFGVPGAR